MSTPETLKEMNEKSLDTQAPPGTTFAVVGLTYFVILILLALAVAAYMFIRPASPIDSTEPENTAVQTSRVDAGHANDTAALSSS